MRYVEAGDAGQFELNYEGPTLDVVTLVVTQMEFQTIVNRVVLTGLAAERLIDFPEAWWSYRETRFRSQPSWGWSWFGPPIEELPVRLQVRRISYGSPLLQELVLAVALVFSDPNVLDVLRGVGANVITSMAASRIRGIFGHVGPREQQDHLPIVDVGPNVRRIAVALADNANGQRATLRVSHKRGNERQDVELEIEPTIDHGGPAA